MKILAWLAALTAIALCTPLLAAAFLFGLHEELSRARKLPR